MTSTPEPAWGDAPLGMRRLERPAGASTWHLSTDDLVTDPNGEVRGGDLVTLALAAMSDAVAGAAPGRPAAATNATTTVHFVRGAVARTALTCNARVVSAGRRVMFSEAEVVDDDGALVARVSATYLLTPRAEDRP